jgi:hypothetical protein
MKKYLKTAKEYADVGGRNNKHSIKYGRFSKIAIMVLFAVGINICNSCDDKSDKEDGEEAAAAFCQCFKTKSRDACLKELEKNYSKATYTSDAFIEAFNNAQTCNTELELIRTTASSPDNEITIRP